MVDLGNVRNGARSIKYEVMADRCEGGRIKAPPAVKLSLEGDLQSASRDWLAHRHQKKGQGLGLFVSGLCVHVRPNINSTRSGHEHSILPKAFLQLSAACGFAHDLHAGCACTRRAAARTKVHRGTQKSWLVFVRKQGGF